MDQLGSYNEFQIVINEAINRQLQAFMDILERDLIQDITDGQSSLEPDELRELFMEYRRPVNTMIQLDHIKKKRVKKAINCELRCRARIGLGPQCSRSKVDNTKYCKSHNMSLPYGCIDEPSVAHSQVSRKRGRKSHNAKTYTLEDLDMTNYVQAILLTIGGEKYFLDENNIMYTCDMEVVGYVESNEVHWCT